MRTYFLFAFTVLTTLQLFSQTIKFGYEGRKIPGLQKEKVTSSHYISEIMPDFQKTAGLEVNDYHTMQKLIKTIDYPQTENYILPTENYLKVIDILSSEISTVANGKNITTVGSNNLISEEQKKLMSTSEMGTLFEIKLKFKFKCNSQNIEDNSIKSATYLVYLIPATEAQYSGGITKMADYFTDKVISKISGPSAARNFYGSVVKFTVLPDGKISDIKMIRSSGDEQLNKLILDATKSMPEWIPAKDVKGENIKQFIRISFGGEGGGC